MTTNLKGNGTATTGSHVSAALLVVKDFLINTEITMEAIHFLFLLFAFFYTAL